MLVEISASHQCPIHYSLKCQRTACHRYTNGQCQSGEFERTESHGFGANMKSVRVRIMHPTDQKRRVGKFDRRQG